MPVRLLSGISEVKVRERTTTDDDTRGVESADERGVTLSRARRPPKRGDPRDWTNVTPDTLLTDRTYKDGRPLGARVDTQRHLQEVDERSLSLLNCRLEGARARPLHPPGRREATGATPT
ncbi:hypothetical protein MTO96_027815 [Rhipicephalus appendiculatus]